MDKQKIIGIIPARMKSSRFPGKPLADINGKPMVVHVAEAVAKASLIDKVFVATDSQEIVEGCSNFKVETILTEEKHATGTDRVAEVALKTEADIYVNIQGDEPLIEPETVDLCVSSLLADDAFEVVNLCAPITELTDLVDATVPKVVKTTNGKAIFLSRAGVPYPKNPSATKYFRQVCVYAFRRKALTQFSELKRGPIEQAEDIELLRFIENDIPVKMVEVISRSFGVDTPADLERARRELKNN